MEPYVPFCGVPPLPSDLWTRWTFDPWLLSGLAIFGALLGGFASDRRMAVGGWTVTALLFISPLCAASMALFSARVAQHVLLVLVAAPLIAMAVPRIRLPILPVAAAFAVIFWLWHLPGPYAATLTSDLIYWSMHISTFGGAIVLWSALRGKLLTAPGPVALGLALTAGQMTLLSVWLFFSQTVWHDWHAMTTVPFGIGPLTDQQLAGAIMWAAGGTLLLIGVASLSWRFVETSARADALGLKG